MRIRFSDFFIRLLKGKELFDRGKTFVEVSLTRILLFWREREIQEPAGLRLKTSVSNKKIFDGRDTPHVNRCIDRLFLAV